MTFSIFHSAVFFLFLLRLQYSWHLGSHRHIVQCANTEQCFDVKCIPEAERIENGLFHSRGRDAATAAEFRKHFRDENPSFVFVRSSFRIILASITRTRDGRKTPKGAGTGEAGGSCPIQFWIDRGKHLCCPPSVFMTQNLSSSSEQAALGRPTH